MGKLTTLKNRVPLLPARLQTVNPESWRAGKTTSAQRGYGYKWQQARLVYLNAYPICVYCEQKGLVVAGTVVDHIVPHKGDQTLFWARANWQTLCKDCHNSVKKAEEAQGLR
ncbi:HNH endonuclease [Pseudomonas syringae group genomosp. 7]|uniref:HNH endonuclease n=1 Tax=Pseudomonas syringae group genomosp. 7 TaxID=251699 RepID=UPI000EFEB612|nr:HNH endonuclease signature motif containing protein [Pseudomonas syringae group genomosp. 7]